MQIQKTEYIEDGFIISDGPFHIVFNRAVRGSICGLSLERAHKTFVVEGSEVKSKIEYISAGYIIQSETAKAEKLMVELGIEILNPKEA